MSNKSIDINQRIPIDTLYVALQSYLNGSYSNEYILEQLRLEFDGENRLKKALRIVNKIILKNPLTGLLTEYKSEIENAIKIKADRDVIIIALLNSAFPFSFEVLRTFGKYFTVQDIINTETVKKPISNIYGGNRATENGLYSVVPMFIEAGFFKRPKAGVYERNEALKVISPISQKLYFASFQTHMTVFDDSQSLDPYFLFISL